MCMSSPTYYFSMQNTQSKRCRVRVHRLLTRGRVMRSDQENRGDGKEMMVLKNLKLYIENMNILEENEKLRKKANLLHKENLELMSEIQKKKFSLIRSS